MFIVTSRVASSCAAAAPPPNAGPPAVPAWTAGVDASAVPSLEAGGARYHDADGRPGTALAILHRHGENRIRLRLFVDPFHDFDKKFGAVQDLLLVTASAERAHAAGMAVPLDLHYADT